MKKYIAVGCWKESKGDVVSVAAMMSTKKHMKDSCVSNDFIAWAIFSEKDVERMKEMSRMERYEAVKKACPYFGHWLIVDDYVNQCFDIMEERLAEAF